MIRREVTIGDCNGVPVQLIGGRASIVIYAISPTNGTAPVYIGSTTQSLRTRIRGHVLDAKAGSALPIHCWIREHTTGFKAEVLEQFWDGDAVRVDREKHWVSQFAGLLNLTDGGPGASGLPWSAERRERTAAAIRSGDHFSCQTCGARFWRKLREIKLGNNKFCSRGCYAASRKGESRPIPEHVRQRGIEAAAKAKRSRTHCSHGHEFAPENTRVNKSGARICRTCERASKRRFAEGASHVHP